MDSFDVEEYVKLQAHHGVAIAKDYIRKTPEAQAALETYALWSTPIKAVGLAVAVHSFPDLVQEMAANGAHYGVIVAGLWKGLNDVVDDIMQEHAAAVMKAFIRTAEAPEQKGAPPLNADALEDKQLEAQWSENARIIHEQREQAQRQADRQVDDQLVAALQKDAAVLQKDAEEKAEQKKAELPELSQEAQDQRRRDGDEQANLSAAHAEQGAKQDKEVARLREQLSERYSDAPDAVKAHLEKFDAAAKAVKAAREDRQATEMRELVEKQSRIQASPTQEDPTRY